ncbi:MAG: hypothetical protein RLZZ450_5959 [Pseudomonadota bacterium]
MLFEHALASHNVDSELLVVPLGRSNTRTHRSTRSPKASSSTWVRPRVATGVVLRHRPGDRRRKGRVRVQLRHCPSVLRCGGATLPGDRLRLRHERFVQVRSGKLCGRLGRARPARRANLLASSVTDDVRIVIGASKREIRGRVALEEEIVGLQRRMAGVRVRVTSGIDVQGNLCRFIGVVEGRHGQDRAGGV